MTFIVSLAAPIISRPIIAAGAVTPSSIQILLTTPSAGPSGISAYELLVYNGASVLISTLKISSFPYTLTGLASSTIYQFRVFGIENSGSVYASVASNTLNVTTGSTSSAPPQVTWLTVPAAQSSSSISMAWNPDSTASTYTIERNGAAIQTGYASTSFTDNGLLASTSYTYNVAGVNASGTGPYSVTESATTQSQSQSGNVTVSGFNSNLLADINNVSGSGRFYLGQHLSVYDSNPFDYMDDILASTGKQPAIAGVFAAIAGGNENWVANANTWIGMGGIVEVTWNYPSIPPGVTPGNPSGWNSIIDALAAQLKQINGEVILRLWPEFNGGWEPYGPNWQSPSQGAALFAYTVERLISDGVKNCLMMYNINAGQGNYTAWYPGPSYVDIVSCDSYPPGAGDITSWYDEFLTLGKPIMMGEFGGGGGSPLAPNSFNNYNMVKYVQANLPKVFGGCIWCQTIGIPVQLGEAQLMSDPTILLLNNVPSGEDQ